MPPHSPKRSPRTPKANGRPTKRRADAGLRAALEAAGSVSAIATLLGITPSAVTQWPRLPAQHVDVVAQTYRLARRTLRPDLYDDADRLRSS